MYELAASVVSCLGAGTRVDLAWLVDVHGLAYRNQGDALVMTPGGGRIGSILGGALNDDLAELAQARSAGRLVDVPISEFAAVLAGLPAPKAGAMARCVLIPASQLPDGLWPLLVDRAPLGLVTEFKGDELGSTTLFTAGSITDAGAEVARLFERETTAVEIVAGSLVTVLWPVPRLVLVGSGPMIDALEAAAKLVDWTPVRITTEDDVRRIPHLHAADGIVIAAHDVNFAGAALGRALAGNAGYIGALGSRAMQSARREWLVARDVDAGDRIHGPAGLDIGARKPGEVAIAIVAEMLATRPRA